jgi:hypothetical protein
MSDTVIVTPDNFVRAETDTYFALRVKITGIGKFGHHREPMPIDNQTVVRANLDTLYSTGVFDLDAGPLTVTLPDAGSRFRSLLVITEDQYTPQVLYDAGSVTFTKEQIGTRYVMLGLRTLVNPADPTDLDKVHALQDATQVEQASPGKWEAPEWDTSSQKRVRDALLALYATLPNSDRMFGKKEEVDPLRYVVGAAAAWGGNPEAAAKYLNVTPAKNDGKTVYRLNVRDVPVDGFWSVIVYNADGYIPDNDRKVYSFNNLTAKQDADGSFTIQFGGCDGSETNCLPIVAGWNYMVRLYRPRAEVLNGRWSFPEAQPMS